MGAAFAEFGDQEQTANVGDKGDRCDGHHLQRLRITAKQKAPANFDQNPSGKDKRSQNGGCPSGQARLLTFYLLVLPLFLCPEGLEVVYDGMYFLICKAVPKCRHREPFSFIERMSPSF